MSRFCSAKNPLALARCSGAVSMIAIAATVSLVGAAAVDGSADLVSGEALLSDSEPPGLDREQPPPRDASATRSDASARFSHRQGGQERDIEPTLRMRSLLSNVVEAVSVTRARRDAIVIEARS